MKKLKTFESFVNEGRPFFQETPNEFAYLDFKKWAYKKRGYIKNRLETISDSSYFFIELKKIWMEWANKNAKEWSHVHSTPVAEKDFGRALASMMKADNLVIKKAGNKLIDLK
tara:strand:+ start:347 stop:685 length:339 start_codon:yes stop_codon:yes gene_type:complete